MFRDLCSKPECVRARFSDGLYATSVGRDTLVHAWGLEITKDVNEGDQVSVTLTAGIQVHEGCSAKTDAGGVESSGGPS